MDRSKTIVPILWHNCNNGAVYMILLSRDGIKYRMIFMNYNKSPGLATPPVNVGQKTCFVPVEEGTETIAKQVILLDSAVLKSTDKKRIHRYTHYKC